MYAPCLTSHACHHCCWMERKLEGEMVHYLPNFRDLAWDACNLWQFLISVDSVPDSGKEPQTCLEEVEEKRGLKSKYEDCLHFEKTKCRAAVLNLDFTLELPGALQTLHLRHTSKDSHLLVLGCMLGIGNLLSSLGYFSVQPRLRVTDLEVKLETGKNPRKLDFRVQLERYNAMQYWARINKEFCSFYSTQL